ncbi:MAG: hypothetical protein EPO08_15850, partial [Rhodospirillaceae bacterium]
MAKDSFEIYYYQDGRWSVHASFEASQRELALGEAQELEKTLRAPVRLVRETYYPETNTTEEAVSWQSALAKQMPDADRMFGDKAPAPKKPPRPKPPPPEPRRKEPDEPAATPAKKAPPKKRKKKKRGRGFAAKLAIVVAMTLAMSAVAVGLTAAGIYVLEYFKRIPNDVDRSGLIAIVYLTASILSFLYQLIRQFDLSSLWKFRRRPAAPPPSATDMIRKMQEANRAPAEGQAASSESTAADIPIEELREQIEQADTEDQVDRLQEDDFTTEVQVAEDSPRQQDAPLEPPVVETAPPPPEPPKPKPEAPKVEKPPEKPVEKPPEKSPAEAEAQKNFLAFTSAAVNVANRPQSPLNAFSRFGLNLYLAGACSTLGQAKKLGRMPQLTILRDGLQAAGSSRERAETFCAELPSYGKNPRYASMVQAGGQAMTRQLSG